MDKDWINSNITKYGNSHNINNNKNKRGDLQKILDSMLIEPMEEDLEFIKQIKNDNDNEFKFTISSKIERSEFMHTEEENNILNEINAKFQKLYSYKEKIVSITNFKSEFGDNFLKKFAKVGWENLIELNLNNNNISSIKRLCMIPLLNLESMDLLINNISDIDNIEHLQILNLKKINLEKNKIYDPFVFITKKFECLCYLNLSNNDIDESGQKRI